jgi:hypothetical protein
VVIKNNESPEIMSHNLTFQILLKIKKNCINGWLQLLPVMTETTDICLLAQFLKNVIFAVSFHSVETTPMQVTVRTLKY